MGSFIFGWISRTQNVATEFCWVWRSSHRLGTSQFNQTHNCYPYRSEPESTNGRGVIFLRYAWRIFSCVLLKLPCWHRSNKWCVFCRVPFSWLQLCSLYSYPKRKSAGFKTQVSNCVPWSSKFYVWYSTGVRSIIWTKGLIVMMFLWII